MSMQNACTLFLVASLFVWHLPLATQTCRSSVVIMAPTKGVSSSSAWVDKSQVAAIVSVDQPQAVVVDNGRGVEVPVGPNICCDHIGGAECGHTYVDPRIKSDKQVVAT